MAKFQNGSYGLYDIITSDERWIYHRQIHHKSKNASCLGADQSPTTVVRRSKSEAQNFFSTLFKRNGPVLVHCVDEDKTVDHNYYIENCLKPFVKEIWKQRRSTDTTGIKLLDDNARAHIHSDVIDYLTEEGMNIMAHPPNRCTVRLLGKRLDEA